MLGRSAMNKEKYHKFINDRGSSLVMALIVVSFIAAIGMAIITMALSFYKIVGMEGRGKKAYYNADMALDEIKTGVSELAYANLGNSYSYVVGNLLTVSGDTTSMIDNETANRLLRNKYFEYFCTDILASSYSTAAEMKNNIDNAFLLGGEIENGDLDSLADQLKCYLSAGFKTPSSNTVVTVKVHNNPVVAVDGVGAAKVIKSVTIKDVEIIYQNTATDYFSEVAADVRVVFPEDAELKIVPATNDVLMSFKDYTLVADDTLNFVAKSNVNGGIYGQNMIYATLWGATDDDSMDPFFEAQPAKTLAVNNGNIVTRGKILLKNKLLLDFNNGRVWADNFVLKGTEAKLGNNASAYIADDLTMDVHPSTYYNNKVTIDGNYYGYSIEGHGVDESDSSHAKSSAIIINSKDSKLNLSSLRTLILGGYGWVRYNSSSSLYYRTGESIAVRYAQTAYMLPSSWGSTVDTNFYGKCLLDSTTPVIENIISPTRGTEYYYNFKSGDAAAKFYRGLYNDILFNELCTESGVVDTTAAAEIRAYIRNIVNEAYKDFLGSNPADLAIKINPNARVYEKGIIRDNASGVNDFNGVEDAFVKVLYANSVHRNKIIASTLIELPDDWTYIAAEWTPIEAHAPILYDSMRYNYKIKSASVLTKGAVENTVLGKDKITGTFFHYIQDDTTGMNTTDYMVCVSNAATLTIDSTFPLFKGIIICTGNVDVKRDFTGTILAFGDINVVGDANFSKAPELVESILRNVPGVRGYFDGISDTTLGRHNSYNDGVPAPGFTEEPGADELDAYKAEDCIKIDGYRKNSSSY